MPFLTDLHQFDIRPQAGRDSWVTETPLIFQSSRFGTITVPAGFESDLATVPRLLRFIIHPSSRKIRIPAVLHDYCLSAACSLSKKAADQIFYEALPAVPNPARPWEQWVYFQCVKWGSHKQPQGDSHA